MRIADSLYPSISYEYNHTTMIWYARCGDRQIAEISAREHRNDSFSQVEHATAAIVSRAHKWARRNPREVSNGREL